MKVLLVEDDQQTSELLSATLSAHRYAVDAIADGSEGLDLATHWSYDMADQLQQSFDRINTALAESEEKFTIIFRSSPDLIALMTLAEGRCVEANDSFLDVLEYSREALIGQRLVDLGIWSDRSDLDQLHDILQQNGHVRIVLPRQAPCPHHCR